MGTRPIPPNIPDRARTPVQRDTALRLVGGYKRFHDTPGRSGSGKSTLLRILAGLDTLDAGTIHWTGGGSSGRPHTGVVFQQPRLMPWLTVGENIAYGGRFRPHRDHFDAAHATGLLSRFGLHDLAERTPDQLSGGQAQRVAIIRAVAIGPELLSLAEPFSALEPSIRADLRGWLREVTAELDMTVVLITHDIDEAIELADRIVLLGDTGTIRDEWVVASAPTRDCLRREIFGSYSGAVGADPVGEPA